MTPLEEAELLKLRIVVNDTIDHMDKCLIKDIAITIALRKASLEMARLSKELQNHKVEE